MTKLLLKENDGCVLTLIIASTRPVEYDFYSMLERSFVKLWKHLVKKSPSPSMECIGYLFIKQIISHYFHHIIKV